MDQNRGQRNRTPSNNNPEPEDNENGGWQALLGVAAGVAALAAGAYVFSRSSQEESTSTSSSRMTRASTSPGMPSQRWTSSSSSSSCSKTVHSNPKFESTKSSVTLTVDATPTQGGGILQMSNGSRKIMYFYSVNWSNYVQFPHQPDKFEMFNALLALITLKQQILNLKTESWADFVIKVDNNFIDKPSYADSEDDRVLQRFRKELNCLQGTALQVYQGFDEDMKNANQLSKGGAKEWIRHQLHVNYAGFTLCDMSDEVMIHLGKLLDILPSKYHC